MVNGRLTWNSSAEAGLGIGLVLAVAITASGACIKSNEEQRQHSGDEVNECRNKEQSTR
jgi:hypothetical protein